MYQLFQRTSVRARVGASMAALSVLLILWVGLNVAGFDDPVLEVSVTSAELALIPGAWIAAVLKRRSGLREARALRARVLAIMADDLIVPMFQPIVDAATCTVLGAEALSRFPQSDGMTSPDIWFKGAARVGLGVQLELHAARIALLRAHRLPAEMYVSVNLSPAAILSGRFSDLVRECQWRPDRLILEITEHSSVDDYGAITAALEDLRQEGMRLAVDDAGAGYSSFRHILVLNPDVIKLDRSLVADVDTDRGRRALASAMRAFAVDIGAVVVAEGVETYGELATMREIGVHAAQGYFTGRPAPASSFSKPPPAPGARGAQRNSGEPAAPRTPQATVPLVDLSRRKPKRG